MMVINYVPMSYNYASHDKIQKITQQVEDVKGTMINNIDLVLNRGEKLENLQQKASDLAVESNTFRRKSKSLKDKLCIQNMKLTLVIIFIILAIIAIIIISICVGGHC